MDIGIISIIVIQSTLSLLMLIFIIARLSTIYKRHRLRIWNEWGCWIFLITRQTKIIVFILLFVLTFLSIFITLSIAQW